MMLGPKCGGPVSCAVLVAFLMRVRVKVRVGFLGYRWVWFVRAPSARARLCFASWPEQNLRQHETACSLFCYYYYFLQQVSFNPSSFLFPLNLLIFCSLFRFYYCCFRSIAFFIFLNRFAFAIGLFHVSYHVTYQV